ncbi:hypothetical protein EDC04DRAFT_2610706 [Pisolithus marmoratus]|nr:hypothetical protein EDC04DRAFT_2610706 [Pisolithus marmoratus]
MIINCLQALAMLTLLILPLILMHWTRKAPETNGLNFCKQKMITMLDKPSGTHGYHDNICSGVSMTWLDSLKTNFGHMKKTAKEHREAAELAYLVASANITVKNTKEEEHHFEHLLGQLSALLEATSWGKLCIKQPGSAGLSKYTGSMLEQLAGEEDMADLEAKCHHKELWVAPKIKLGAPVTIFDLSFLNVCMDEAHHMHSINSKYWAVLAMCD